MLASTTLCRCGGSVICMPACLPCLQLAATRLRAGAVRTMTVMNQMLLGDGMYSAQIRTLNVYIRYVTLKNRRCFLDIINEQAERQRMPWRESWCIQYSMLCQLDDTGADSAERTPTTEDGTWLLGAPLGNKARTALAGC